MNIQLSSRSDLWYTPIPIMNRVRSVLGHIDLDPASDVHANDIVGAFHIFTEEEDGLVQDWSRYGNIYLNPPGGKVGNKSLANLFWQKLMSHTDDFDHAIYMGFSVEQLAVSQGKGCPSIMEFPFCVPEKRIQFVCPKESKTQPSHSNVIVYVPGRKCVTELFYDSFCDLGDVKL